MKKFIFLFIAMLSHSVFALESRHIVLGGELRLPLQSSRIWIEDGKIIKGEVAGSYLRLQALSEGSSLLSIGDKSYQVFVIHPKQQKAYLSLRENLKKFLGLSVELIQGQARVSGRIFRLQDWKTLAESLSSSDVSYQMFVQLSESLQTEAQEYFDHVFEKNHLPKQKISFGEPISIRLPIKYSYLPQYQRLLEPYGIYIQEDAQALALEPTIKVQITVAEVQRSFFQKIGLQWPESYEAQILPSAFWNFENLNAVAHFFEENGQGRVLASPNILCRSGKEAEFLAGGEFPIKIMNLKLQDVVWKKYGILLKVKPLADARGQMSLQIETEVSSLDGSKTVDGIPGIITHKVSSYFDMRSTQTIALSGLIKNKESQSINGLPWLSRIPVLGQLFSSKDFRENRTELVIFVRPEIIDTDKPQNASPQHIGTTEVAHAR